MKNIDYGFVADIYDDYVNVDFDIPFYKSICRKYNGNILELMCGTGRVSLPLLKEGTNLTCVDYSREMLEVFRKKPNGEKALLLCQDVCELDINKMFEFIFIPFNSFSEITDREKRKQAVKKITEHLVDGGDFLITLYNPDYRKQTADGNMRYLGKYDISDNRTLVISYYNSFSSTSNLVSGIQFYEIYDLGNKLIEKRFMNIAFSLITKEEVDELCEEFELSIKEIFGGYDYDAFSSKSRFMNFLLTKRARS